MRRVLFILSLFMLVCGCIEARTIIVEIGNIRGNHGNILVMAQSSTNTFAPCAPLIEIVPSESHTPGACDNNSVPSFPADGMTDMIKRSAFRSIFFARTTTSLRTWFDRSRIKESRRFIGKISSFRKGSYPRH